MIVDGRNNDHSLLKQFSHYDLHFQLWQTSVFSLFLRELPWFSSNSILLIPVLPRWHHTRPPIVGHFMVCDYCIPYVSFYIILQPYQDITWCGTSLILIIYQIPEVLRSQMINENSQSHDNQIILLRLTFNSNHTKCSRYYTFLTHTLQVVSTTFPKCRFTPFTRHTICP